MNPSIDDFLRSSETQTYGFWGPKTVSVYRNLRISWYWVHDRCKNVFAQLRVGEIQANPMPVVCTENTLNETGKNWIIICFKRHKKSTTLQKLACCEEWNWQTAPINQLASFELWKKASATLCIIRWGQAVFEWKIGYSLWRSFNQLRSKDLMVE